MNKGLASRRILWLVIISVLMSALVTLGVYSVLMPRFFAQANMTELYPRAQFLAEQASMHFLTGHSTDNAGLLGVDSRQWGATVWLFDKNHAVIASTDEHVGYPIHSGNIDGFDGLLAEVFAGAELSKTIQMRAPSQNGAQKTVGLLFIGLPVHVDGAVEGAVIMLKSLEDVLAALSSLLSTLWFSVFAVLCAMLPIAYWLTKLITRPISEMRHVALRMAGGDFEIRANVNEKGEVGDLARAFNLLSNELGNTFGELKRERNQALGIVNALGEGILAVDADCRPTLTNPSLQSLLISAGGGRSLPLPQSIWPEAFRVALTENYPVDRTFLHGSLLLHLTVTPLEDTRAGVSGAIGVFHDETQAYRLEQTRREYVANVSHELRTPLTALRALIEPLRDGLIRTEQQRRDIYDTILRETLRLSRLVDDMLELSRLQSGTLALEKLRIRLEPLLNEIASIYAAKAAKTGHIIGLDIVSPPLPTVLCNADRVEQVLVALLNNAFTYTPKGSHIVLRAEPMEDYALVTVEDDGPGIKPEDLPHVFDRFYKADKSHGGTGGTGLGLAISQELMRRMGEEITAENRETGGARFMLTLHYR